jgi:hypothetical protein
VIFGVLGVVGVLGGISKEEVSSASSILKPGTWDRVLACMYLEWCLELLGLALVLLFRV